MAVLLAAVMMSFLADGTMSSQRFHEDALIVAAVHFIKNSFSHFLFEQLIVNEPTNRRTDERTMDTGSLSLGVAFPAEASYAMPLSLPGGMKQTTLRVPNYNTISGQSVPGSGTPAGLEIQIIVPQLDGCFALPDTSLIHTECTLDVKYLLSNAAAPVALAAIGLSASNGGILGSGASIYNRYQLYLNTSVLSDDIIEFGLLSHFQFLVALNKSNRFSMAQPLGLNKYYPCGCVGQAFNGWDLSDRAQLIAVPTVTGTTDPLWYASNTDNGFSSRIEGVDDIEANLNGSNWFGYSVNQGASATCTYSQTLSFSLLLPGLFGSGSNKLFPLFVGPTRISLTTDVQSNYLFFDLPAASTTTVPTTAPIITASICIKSMWLVVDYIRCDGPSFDVILSSLPIPDTFVIKSTAWSVASANFAKDSQGQYDILVPIRRASNKCLYICPSPTMGAGEDYNPFGKFGWVNPSLTNGTCVTVNGVMFPQQTNDPVNRPDEMISLLYKTLQCWHNDASRPSISPNNFLVIDAWTTGIAASGASKTPEILWRPVKTTHRRGSGGFSSTSSVTLAGGEDFMNYSDHSIWNPTPKFDQSGTTPFAATFPEGFVPFTVYREGTIALSRHSGTDRLHDTYSQSMMMDPHCSQFIYAADFEYIAKNNYLSGVSSLNGSFFFRANVKNRLLFQYNLYYFLCFDMLTILNAALKTATVKI